MKKKSKRQSNEFIYEFFESQGSKFFNIKTYGNLNKGVENAIGVDLDELSIQWQKYLKKEYWPDVEFRDDVRDISRQITNHIDLFNP